MSYAEYLQSDAWGEKRDRIMQRDRGTCRYCGCGATDVHHKTYDRIFSESDDDLVAICRECHQFVHDKLSNKRDWQGSSPRMRQIVRIEAYKTRALQDFYKPEVRRR